MSQVRILSPRPKTKPVRWTGFVFGLGSRVRACEAGSAEASAQATPERRPVGRAKRVNPVAPTKNQTCLLGRFCFWIGKPGSSLRSRFSRSVSAGNAGTAARRASKASKSCRPDHVRATGFRAAPTDEAVTLYFSNKNRYSLYFSTLFSHSLVEVICAITFLLWSISMIFNRLPCAVSRSAKSAFAARPFAP